MAVGSLRGWRGEIGLAVRRTGHFWIRRAQPLCRNWRGCEGAAAAGNRGDFRPPRHGGTKVPHYFFDRSSAAQDVRNRVVALVTCKLQHPLAVVHRQRHRECPGSCPCRSIIHRHRPLEPGRRRSCEAFNQTQRCGVRVPIRAAILEVGGFDDERVAVPAAARVAELELETLAQMGPAVERDDPRVVHELVADGDETGRLDDLIRVAVDVPHHRARQTACDAAIPQREVLEAVERALAEAADAAAPMVEDPADAGISNDRAARCDAALRASSPASFRPADRR